MPDVASHVKQDVFLPAGSAVYALKFGGTALPRGAAITGALLTTGPQSFVQNLANLAFVAETTLMAKLSAGVQLQEIYLRAGATVGPGPSGSQFSTTNGLVAGELASPNVAFLVKMTTALGGRRGRGRWFLPCVGEANVDQVGVVAAARRTELNTMLTDFRVALASLDLIMAVAHRYPEGTVTGRLAPTAVDQITCDARVATQRGRLR